jgi:hypothetical protein
MEDGTHKGEGITEGSRGAGREVEGISTIPGIEYTPSDVNALVPGVNDRRIVQ